MNGGAQLSAPDAAFPWTWHWRKKLPARKGQRCRVLARGAMNSILIQFEDDFRVVTSRYAVRRAA